MKKISKLFFGRRTTFLAAFLISISLTIDTSHAVAPTVAQTGAAQGDRITLNFQDADIQAFISTVSQITGRNFIIDPRVKGKVTLVSGDKLSIDQVYQVFLSVLEVHNFAAIDTETGITKVVPASLVKQSPTPTSSFGPPPEGDAYVTQIYQLKHGSAQELIPVLRPLLPPTSHFAAHAPSNTLVFTDTASNVKRVLKVVSRIDQPQARGDIHVVYLQYAKATEMVSLLNNILTSRQKTGDAKAKAQPVSVQADEATNSLVLQAPQDEFVFIQDVINRLDIRRAQVFVEVLIAEVGEDKAADIGVRWEFNDNNLQTGQTSGNTGFSDVTGGLTLGYISELVTNLFGEEGPELSVVLSALRSDSNANIISTPNLLTLDNETAEIVVGQEVPFVTGQFTTGTTTTTDPETGAVVNPFQTIERKDVGLTLKLTPQINKDNSMRLEIEQELSSVSPTVVEGASDLITDTRSIKATVMVDDAQIIVLGGLIRDDMQDTVEWVPVLGKIPVVGSLFRKKSKSAVKRNLMVFLRPKIVRSHWDLAGHTRDKYELVRQQQRESLPDTKHLLYGTKKPLLPELPPGSQNVDDLPWLMQDGRPWLQR